MKIFLDSSAAICMLVAMKFETYRTSNKYDTYGYTLHVRGGRHPYGGCKGSFAFSASGTPFELSRLVPSVKYALNNKTSTECKVYLKGLFDSFYLWQDRRRAALCTLTV